MIIYLYGPDSYRLEEKAREIVGTYQKKHFNHTHEQFDLREQGEGERLATFLRNVSLFDSHKLGILRSPECAERSVLSIISAYSDSPLTTLLVIAERKLGKDFKFLDKTPHVQSFDHLEGRAFLAWVGQKATRLGVKLSPDTARSLTAMYLHNTWGVVTELEKMALGGETYTGNVMPAFFPLVQQLVRGSIKTRVSALGYLLVDQEPAAVFNIAATLADADQKQQFARYDVMIKSGRLEYADVLTDLVLTS